MEGRAFGGWRVIVLFHTFQLLFDSFGFSSLCCCCLLPLIVSSLSLCFPFQTHALTHNSSDSASTLHACFRS